ncbi:Zn-dependent exopeptidase M28, partial [Aduncisulcus paluster]
SYETYKVPNVIGYLPATRDEPLGTILFSAHFDHVGINGDGSYNPGALDNASGVAALLELARAAALTDGQRDYTLAFAAFNSEEEGLLGSFHYVDHPLCEQLCHGNNPG